MGGVSQSTRPRVWWGLGDAILVFVIGFVLGQVAGGVYVVATGVDENLSSDLVLIAITLIGQGAGWIGGAALIARWKGRGSIAADFGSWWPRWRDLPWLAAGVALQVVVGIIALPLNLLRDDDGAVQSLVESISEGTGFWKFVVVAAVVTIGPAAEEILFRGVLLRGLQRRMDHGWAVAVSAAAFALLHVIGDDPLRLLLGLVPWLCVGLLCGIRAVRSGGLAQPILIHIGFNLLAGILLLVGVDIG